ncbi:MAG: 3-methyl-2-oxobutanoate dehydrogenase subunit VorB [Omnitrophica bacterium RIFCSPLOWO2_02_FULL_45_16]|nr:MAG: 3-methyl-2-oxobutanoate dehydrogenase subunit VorB [Omnitrophica bacterium RIFCSPHIGHO2_02_FULL_46_20]OGW93290.1 MAG: 3-methyl-2-oxobutanoate dehydrogenase subunit VorB [Omnitrophica bacterium RIFCSPLOWO2_01_FULL_45_24]OGX00215.1 MAG: 3-methyl-2-oxobutanoate dehydrogenase subunit VorB [Omnitrophica bacterium RIFCSPLOWO2_02_FULL_45_16]
MTRKMLMCGNDACGEGAILAGCAFYAGYPITPQNELTAYMAKRMGETGGVFIQAESELAAINMVFGASVAGVRAMTSSSSPGISLKQEGISYLAGCELPCVIVNMQRGGPGLGNIAPAQGDYFQAVKGGGHGDYKIIVLAPASAQELMDYTYIAFDLADKYRNPVMILGDGLLGQMMEPIQIKSVEGRPLVDKPWALTGCKGRQARFIRSLFLGDGALEEHNKKLQEKFNNIKKNEIRAETLNIKDADIILVAYGSVARIARAGMELGRAKGLKVGLIRPITLWPFPEKTIADISGKAKKFLVVEMSAGQMVEDVMLAVKGRAEVDFYGRMGGGIPTEEEILKKIEALVKQS